MNILDLKRKAAGWMARGYGSDSDGGASEGVGGEGAGAGNAGAAGGDSMGSTSNDGYGGGADYSGYNPANTIGSPNFSAAERDAIGRLEGFNINNPTQSIAEMQAAQNVHGFMNYAAPAFANMVAPGFGTAMSIGKVAAGVLDGSVSLSSALASVGTPALAAAISHATGIPTGLVSGVLAGDLGKGVGGLAVSTGVSAVGQALGLSPEAMAAARMALGASGLSTDAARAISGAVNSLPGVSDVNQSIRGVRDSIAEGVNDFGAATGIGTGGAGGATTGADTVRDAAGNEYTPTEILDQLLQGPGAVSPDRAPWVGSSVTISSGPQTEGADIYGDREIFDILGELELSPHLDVAQKDQNPLKYVYAEGGNVHPAESGDIRDLIAYLRS